MAAFGIDFRTYEAETGSHTATAHRSRNCRAQTPGSWEAWTCHWIAARKISNLEVGSGQRAAKPFLKTTVS